VKLAGAAICVLLGHALHSPANAQDQKAEQAALEANTRELVEQGLCAAAKGDYADASSYLHEASRISEHPIVEHLSAVVETLRSNPGEAFDYAKKSGMSGADGELEALGREQALIVEWARPEVIGTDRDCPYRPKDNFHRCEIEEKGALEALVKKYFNVDYGKFWWSHDKAESVAAVPCPYVEIGRKDPELEPDTARRCEARRIFYFYVFPPPPKVSLPAPGFEFRW